MFIVRVEGLSLGEAEEVVALIWHMLEANDIETPRLATMNRGGIELVLSFESQEAADLITRKLRGVVTRSAAAD